MDKDFLLTRKKLFAIHCFFGAIVSCFMFFLFSLNLPFFAKLNYSVYDWMLWEFHNEKLTKQVVIVDIDDKSLKEVGQWPWPRYKLAKLLEKIQQGQPGAVGFDILFPQKDRTSIQHVYDDLATMFSKVPSPTNIPDDLLNNDAILAHALQNSNSILGALSTFNGRDKTDFTHLYSLNDIALTSNNTSTKSTQKITDLPLTEIEGIVYSIPDLSDAATASGFINMHTDLDGVIRKSPLLFKGNGKIYPSLALSTLLMTKPKQALSIKTVNNQIESICIDETCIPVDERGRMTINYKGTGKRFKFISATDILTNKYPAKKLQDKIVIIGTAASGLKDFHPTPFDTVFPGVEIHATVVDNILSNDFIATPPWLSTANISAIILITFIMVFATANSGLFIGSLVLVIKTAVIFLISTTIFSTYQIFISPVFPTFVVVVVFISIYLIKFYIADKKRRKTERELFEMQDAIVDAVINVTETRDENTGGHIKRTESYIRVMLEELNATGDYKEINGDEVNVICKAAPFHDVGKVGIPDKVLLKPGRLDKDEFDQIKMHTVYGKKIISSALSQTDNNYFLSKALEIAYYHHEKWDGTGYPQGLSAEEIPLSARLMAIADVYDALISKRPYKKPMKHENAVRIIEKDAGTHFDPALVVVFSKIHEKFREIAINFAESEEDKIFLANKERYNAIEQLL